MPEHAISVLDGSTFVVSDTHGDVRPDSRLPPHGFFSADTRFVSRWELTVQGEPTDSLSTAPVDYFVAEFFLVSRREAFHDAPPLSIVRRRLVGDVWLEELLVVNHRNEPAEVALDLEVETDFADLFEVKEDEIRTRDVSTRQIGREVVLSYRKASFVRETRITLSEPAFFDDRTFRFRLSLAPREERTLSMVVTPHAEQYEPVVLDVPRPQPFAETRHERRDALQAWLAEAPALETDGDTLRRVYDRSLRDLAALRFYPHLGDQVGSLPAAGLPWFMTLFGRDSLITSYQSLPFRADLAATTLRTLAARQGTRVDDFRDEEPGKILHEIRFGELTVTGERPHSPYYGTADATPLFVVLLDEYEQWTGDTGLVRELEPNARAALEWIDRYGDLDGDGYVEYQTRNPESGLVNQCWKDSWNSILYADGRLARGPIATCEIQGYVYDAKRRGARLAREVWDDEPLAARLTAEADDLRARFREDFWVPHRACFALALDGSKRRVDSLTSNVGHLLWSGIADEPQAEALAMHLMADELYSGWGVRTMGAAERGYNPVEYHNGTVWPHDNSLIAAGLRRYGFATEAARIAADLVHAARYFDHRLPEAFAGCSKAMMHAPVEYPTASSPQAWAAAAPLLLLTTVLGLTPGPDGPRCDPHVPEEFGHVALSGMRGRWGRADVTAAVAMAPAAQQRKERSMDYAGFIKTVEQEAQIPRPVAERAIAATLETLGERLSDGEARDIAHELPLELRPVIDRGGRAVGFHIDEFLRRVATREGVRETDAERHARAVFAALGQSVSRDELADMASELPKDFQPLLEAAQQARRAPRRPTEIFSAERFAEEVAERAGIDRHEARRATEAALQTLGDRISGGQADDLAAQLPPEMRAPLERGKEETNGAAVPMSLAEFVRAVAEREGVSPGQAREHARAVFATLREWVSEEELSDTFAQLPNEYVAIFPPP